MAAQPRSSQGAAADGHWPGQLPVPPAGGRAVEPQPKASRQSSQGSSQVNSHGQPVGSGLWVFQVVAAKVGGNGGRVLQQLAVQQQWWSRGFGNKHCGSSATAAGKGTAAVDWSTAAQPTQSSCPRGWQGCAEATATAKCQQPSWQPLPGRLQPRLLAGGSSQLQLQGRLCAPVGSSAAAAGTEKALPSWQQGHHFVGRSFPGHAVGSKAGAVGGAAVWQLSVGHCGGWWQFCSPTKLELSLR